MGGDQPQLLRVGEGRPARAGELPAGRRPVPRLGQRRVRRHRRLDQRGRRPRPDPAAASTSSSSSTGRARSRATAPSGYAGCRAAASTPEDNPHVLANRKAKRLASLIRVLRPAARAPGARSRSSARPSSCTPATCARRSTRSAPSTSTACDDVRVRTAQPEGAAAGAARDARAPDRRAARSARSSSWSGRARSAPSVTDRKVGQLLLHPQAVRRGHRLAGLPRRAHHATTTSSAGSGST